MDTKDIKQLDGIIKSLGEKNWVTAFILRGRS